MPILSATQVPNRLRTIFGDGQVVQPDGRVPLLEARFCGGNGNIDIANPPASMGGGTPVAGVDIVFLYAQGDSTENGPYLFNGAGIPLTRAVGAQTTLDFAESMIVWVTEGTCAQTQWGLISDDPIVGTDPIIFQQPIAASYSPSKTWFVDMAFTGLSLGLQINPDKTVQAAVNRGAAGDKIVVAPGSYSETVTTAVGVPLYFEAIGVSGITVDRDNAAVYGRIGNVEYHDNSVVIHNDASGVINGTALKAQYLAAKTVTPNGSALSATNRLALLLQQGTYDLGTDKLLWDTDFIDLIAVDYTIPDLKHDGVAFTEETQTGVNITSDVVGSVGVIQVAAACTNAAFQGLTVTNTNGGNGTSAIRVTSAGNNLSFKDIFLPTGFSANPGQVFSTGDGGVDLSLWDNLCTKGNVKFTDNQGTIRNLRASAHQSSVFSGRMEGECIGRWTATISGKAETIRALGNSGGGGTSLSVSGVVEKYISDGSPLGRSIGQVTGIVREVVVLSLRGLSEGVDFGGAVYGGKVGHLISQDTAVTPRVLATGILKNIELSAMPAQNNIIEAGAIFEDVKFSPGSSFAYLPNRISLGIPRSANSGTWINCTGRSVANTNLSPLTLGHRGVVIGGIYDSRNSIVPDIRAVTWEVVQWVKAGTTLTVSFTFHHGVTNADKCGIRLIDLEAGDTDGDTGIDGYYTNLADLDFDSFPDAVVISNVAGLTANTILKSGQPNATTYQERLKLLPIVEISGATLVSGGLDPDLILV